MVNIKFRILILYIKNRFIKNGLASGHLSKTKQVRINRNRNIENNLFLLMREVHERVSVKSLLIKRPFGINFPSTSKIWLSESLEIRRWNFNNKLPKRRAIGGTSRVLQKLQKGFPPRLHYTLGTDDDKEKWCQVLAKTTVEMKHKTIFNFTNFN